MTLRAGLDVGGAHLKVALVENGSVHTVRQFVCPLWKGLHTLKVALDEAAPLLSQAHEYALTMTGELSDFFPNRATGVTSLLQHIERSLGSNIRVWMGTRGFGTLSQAHEATPHVGSTNFLATATYLARHIPEALFVDFGSTTVDIRQKAGELSYTGYTRTALMAVTTKAPFKGEWVSLAREYLATMADVRRIIGCDLNDVDLHETADGKDKSLLSSQQRFARMFGRDTEEGSEDDWHISALFVREEQIKSILDGIFLVLSGVPLAPTAPLIGAGSGESEIHDIARRLGKSFLSFSSVLSCPTALKKMASTCAPAVSVALLSEI